jgi:oligosaccharide repeat unit polymerase
MNMLFSRFLPALFLVEAIFLMLLVERGFDLGFVRILYISAIALIATQTIRSRLLNRNTALIQLDIFFLAMFFFVHFWVWMAIDLGLILDRSAIAPYAESVNKAVALAFLGMTVFVLAYNVPREKVQDTKRGRTYVPRWRAVGVGLFLAGFFCWVLYVGVYGRAAFEGSYTGTSVGGLLATSLYLAHSILTKLGIVLILTSSASRPWRPALLLLYGLMVLILLSYLVQGDRSEFVLTVAVLLFTYDRYVQRIGMKVVAGGIIALALLMSAVQIARNSDERSLSSIWQAITELELETAFESSANNIGSSGMVYLAAVNIVPDEEEYFYGELKLHELAGILPYLRRLVFTEEQLADVSTTSDFMTRQILGEHADSGTGTTVVADLYIDFGVPGVVLGLALLGYISGFLNARASASMSMLAAVMFGYFAGVLTILPRYSFLKLIRALLWPYVMLWLIQKLLVGQRGNRAARPRVVGFSKGHLVAVDPSRPKASR